MTDIIAGITIPDSRLASDAAEYVREAEPDLLFHHSLRVFLFGSLKGRVRGIEPDPELLFVGALFHDLGLTPRYGTSAQRFEMDGADAAREFLLEHGASATDARSVWLAIALHTTPAITDHLEPEIALVTAGVETDVLGFGLDELDAADIAAITAAHPRPGFKGEILAAFTEGMRHRPDSTFGTMNDDVLAHFVPGFERSDFVDIIRNSPWPE